MTDIMLYSLITSVMLLLGYLNRSWLKVILTPQMPENNPSGTWTNSRYEVVLNRIKKTNRLRLRCTKELNQFKAKQAECIMRGLSQQLQELTRN